MSIWAQLENNSNTVWNLWLRKTLTYEIERVQKAAVIYVSTQQCYFHASKPQVANIRTKKDSKLCYIKKRTNLFWLITSIFYSFKNVTNIISQEHNTTFLSYNEIVKSYQHAMLRPTVLHPQCFTDSLSHRCTKSIYCFYVIFTSISFN